MIIKTSLARKTLDNVTCVMIAFKNFEDFFKGKEESISNNIINKIDYKNYSSTPVISNSINKINSVFQNEEDLSSKNSKNNKSQFHGNNIRSANNNDNDTLSRKSKHESFDNNTLDNRLSSRLINNTNNNNTNKIQDLSFQKKKLQPKKLISLDLTAIKKNSLNVKNEIGSNYNSNDIRRKLDISELQDSNNNIYKDFERKKLISYVSHDLYPNSVKNGRLKSTNNNMMLSTNNKAPVCRVLSSNGNNNNI